MAEEKGNKGDSGKDSVWLLKWVIFVVLVLAVAWFATEGYNRPAAWGGPFIKPLAPIDSGGTYGNLNPDGSIKTTNSPGSSTITKPLPTGGERSSDWVGKINIEKGSAATAIQPVDEYIIIKNISKINEAISISGWTLKNAGVVEGGSGILRGSQRSVVIPQGTIVYNPTQPNILVPIFLNKSERAVITSGKIPNASPYAITSSFKTNLCTGYLDRLPYYNFKPAISATCSDPEDEPGIGSLDDNCFKLIRGLSRCETPEFEFDPQYGEELVDGKLGVSYTCKDFLKLHYNYVGCLNLHSRDNNFIGKEWRVFLNTLPLWSKDRETIYLYDNLGRLVDSLSY